MSAKPRPRFPATLAPQGAKPRTSAGRGAPAARPGVAARPAAPVAVPGADPAARRLHMVRQLAADTSLDPVVLQAMAQVPRHLFVDTALASQAYEDTALPIGHGQTISKPSVVARMVSLLRARPGEAPLRQVLEIGAGCGYQAAVLALVARNVYSIERVRALFDQARANLEAYRPGFLRLIYGDGRLGHPPNAPYDGIIAAAGGDDIPAAWIDQLAPGGRIVAPVAAQGGQALMVIDKVDQGRIERTLHEAVRFVPLESGLD